jgi:hypothetical protein
MKPYEAAVKIRSQKLTREESTEKITIFNSMRSTIVYDIALLPMLDREYSPEKENYYNSWEGQRVFKETRLLWLFYRNIVEDFDDRLQVILIEHASPKLTANDYILLLHISLEDRKTRKRLKGLPLAMLHEIYEPIADATIEDWRKQVSKPEGL